MSLAVLASRLSGFGVRAWTLGLKLKRRVSSSTEMVAAALSVLNVACYEAVYLGSS